MSEQRIIAKLVADTDTLMDNLETEIVTAGWTLHDDQWNGSSGYLVFYSPGNAARPAPIPCYLQVYKALNYIYFQRYMYWNNSTQTGIVRIGSTSCQLTTSDSGSFYYWLYGNEDFIALFTKVASTYDLVFCSRFTPAYRGMGRLTAAASSGSSVTLSLQRGQAANFYINTVACVHDAPNSSCAGRDYRAAIEAVDREADTIDITSLNISLQIGSIVSYMNDYWTVTQNGWTSYMMGSDNYDTTGTAVCSPSDAMQRLIGETYVDPDRQNITYSCASSFYASSHAGAAQQFWLAGVA
jgi:hypothetical protein